VRCEHDKPWARDEGRSMSRSWGSAVAAGGGRGVESILAVPLDLRVPCAVPCQALATTMLLLAAGKARRQGPARRCSLLAARCSLLLRSSPHRAPEADSGCPARRFLRAGAAARHARHLTGAASSSALGALRSRVNASIGQRALSPGLSSAPAQPHSLFHPSRRIRNTLARRLDPSLPAPQPKHGRRCGRCAPELLPVLLLPARSTVSSPSLACCGSSARHGAACTTTRARSRCPAPAARRALCISMN